MNKFFTYALLINLLPFVELHAQCIIPSIQSETFISHNTGGMGALDGSDHFGGSVTAIGDLNGNGVVDIAVGTSGDDDGGTDRGAVYILFMNSAGTADSTYKISDSSGDLTDPLGNSDAFGASVADMGDLDGDGVRDLAVGAHRDDDGGTDRGCVYILFMNTDGTVKSDQKISSLDGDLAGPLSDQDYFGIDVGNAGDIDGDGINDLVVGNYADDDGGINRGAVWVLMLGTDGKVDGEQKISDTQGGFTETLDNSDYFGLACDGIGDIDNDGTPDILVGTYQDDDGANQAGAAYLLFMNSDGTVSSSVKYSDEFDGRAEVLQADWRFGYEVAAAGDVNRDGIEDFIIGAYYAPASHTGYTYIICPDTDGSIKCFRRLGEGFGWEFEGLTGPTYWGRGITYLGDIDADGFEDYAMGVNVNASRGGLYVCMMDTSAAYPDQSGIVLDWDKISEIDGGFTETLDADDEFGYAVAPIGDFTGNGVTDLLVGARFDDDGGTDRGAVYLLFMSDSSYVDSVQKISDTQGSFNGVLGDDDFFGGSVAGIGDRDGDGNIDIAVGATGDDDGGTDRGAIWILFLNADGTVKTDQKISDTDGGFNGTLDDSDALGSSIADIGDINDDGEDDLAVGAINDDDGGSNRGAVWILFMNSSNTVDSVQKISDTDGSFSTTLGDGSNFGRSLTSIGDINSDGTPDVAVGASGFGGEGTVFTLRLSDDGTVSNEAQISDSDLDGKIATSDQFGASITNIGDLNNDGVMDVAIGAVQDEVGEFRTGSFYIVYLNTSGDVSSYQEITSLRGNLLPVIGYLDEFAGGLAYMGDINNDGHPEIAVGAPEDDDGGTDQGAVYVLSLYNTVALVDTNVYAHLSKKLDGGYYTAQQGQLYFKYDEEYFERDSLLTYNIYDRHNDIVVSNTDQAITSLFGDNRCYIDMSCSGNDVNKGWFILEVINEKNEKWYLRFYNNVVCGGGNIWQLTN